MTRDSQLKALGHYRILDRLGAGALGEVYRARDTRHGRTVALKVVGADVADKPDRRERLLHDARAAAALSHPNIAALYEIGEDQNQLFLAFEFVAGEPLKHVIAGRPLHPRRAVDFATQIADALAEGHAQGVVHAGLNTETVVITPKAKAKVLDFGLAAWDARGAAGDYLSPEQRERGRVDHRTDIFSLGAVLFEMLTGRLPFRTSAGVAAGTGRVPDVAPSTINRVVPAELDAVVAKALAASLDERYASAATMAAELLAVAALLDDRTRRSESSGSSPVTMATASRRSGVWWIVLALLAAAVIAAVWFGFQAD
jgi:eukaryotic-like serine/threonine-protein kinase